jgi:hypothetical protein
MAVRRFGDWDRVRAILTNDPGGRLKNALHAATVKNALLLVREIKLGIQRQAPGGKAFVELAESTIRKKGSSKALIDKGFLINAITHKMTEEGAFVGLIRSARGAKGEALVNIGAVMEYGATIQHPNGATIVIPPRPFLHPVMEKYREQVVGNYLAAIQEVVRGR